MTWSLDFGNQIKGLAYAEGAIVAYPMGEAGLDPLRVDFDRRIKLEFHCARITSDGGLLAYRELDDAFELTMSRSRSSSTAAR